MWAGGPDPEPGDASKPGWIRAGPTGAPQEGSLRGRSLEDDDLAVLHGNAPVFLEGLKSLAAGKLLQVMIANMPREITSMMQSTIT